MGGHDATAPDFAAMYRELGLDASCSIDELRAARRRRIARLHPDLGGSEADTLRLQRLNRAYAAAIDFHGRFGRLPGAPAAGTATATETATAIQPGAKGPSQSAAQTQWRRADLSAESQPPAGLGTMSRYPWVARALIAAATLGLVATLAIALAMTVMRLAADDTPGSLSTGGTSAASESAATGADALAKGMDKDTVRKTLGEPLDMHAQRWHYGPSWVDFRCDRVAGWYSAPQRPLPISGPAFEAPDDAGGCD